MDDVTPFLGRPIKVERDLCQDVDQFPTSVGIEGQIENQNGLVGCEGPAIDCADRTDSYEKKYFALLRRCESIQQNNEKLFNRIFHVKKMLMRLIKERRLLMTKLDELGDDYRNLPIDLFLEEDALPPPHLTSASGSATVKSNSTSSTLCTSSPIQSSPRPQSSCGAPPPKKKSRQEKEKDPNAPKRPANPFFLFCQEQRSTIMERHHQEQKDDISHQDLTKTLAKNWNSLSSEDKKIYYDLYVREKERYEQEMKAYNNKDASCSQVIKQEVL